MKSARSTAICVERHGSGRSEERIGHFYDFLYLRKRRSTSTRRRVLSAGLSCEMPPLCSMRIILSILLLVPSISASDRPRGVAKSSLSANSFVTHTTELHLYNPRDDGTWQCLDGSKVIPFEQINDVSTVFSRRTLISGLLRLSRWLR